MGFAQQGLIHVIFCVQKRAICIYIKYKYKCNSCLIYELGILKVKDHILRCGYDFVQDWIHGRVSQTFNNIFDKNPLPCCNIRRNHNKVALPSRCLEIWDTSSLSYQGSMVDLGLHDIKSKIIIKNKINAMFYLIFFY